jgi:hypothetical protein
MFVLEADSMTFRTYSTDPLMSEILRCFIANPYSHSRPSKRLWYGNVNNLSLSSLSFASRLSRTALTSTETTDITSCLFFLQNSTPMINDTEHKETHRKGNGVLGKHGKKKKKI